MIFTEACLRPWTASQWCCAKDFCDLFSRSYLEFLKVISLLNCQGFLDMEQTCVWESVWFRYPLHCGMFFGPHKENSPQIILNYTFFFENVKTQEVFCAG